MKDISNLLQEILKDLTALSHSPVEEWVEEAGCNRCVIPFCAKNPATIELQNSGPWSVDKNLQELDKKLKIILNVSVTCRPSHFFKLNKSVK